MTRRTFTGFIYGIYHPKTGRWYVGQTTRTVEIRSEEHFEKLRDGEHNSYMLQADFQDVSQNIRFVLLDQITDSDKDRLIERLNLLETHWIIEKNARYNTDWPHVEGIQHIKRDNRGRIIPYAKQKPTKKSPKRKGFWPFFWSTLPLTLAILCLIALAIL